MAGASILKRGQRAWACSLPPAWSCRRDALAGGVVSVNGTSPRHGTSEALQLALALPADVVELIAERAAEILAERQGAAASAASPWLSTAGAAEYMACSPARVHDLVQSRALRPRRDGRRLLFRRDELDAYLEGDE
jgi:excisionase family DNA binding protein